MNVQLVSVVEEKVVLYAPPPKEDAELPMKVQLVRVVEVGEEKLYIPPPLDAELPMNVQLLSLSEETIAYRPPPRSCRELLFPLAFPKLTVMPSSKDELDTAAAVTTW